MLSRNADRDLKKKSLATGAGITTLLGSNGMLRKPVPLCPQQRDIAAQGKAVNFLAPGDAELRLIDLNVLCLTIRRLLDIYVIQNLGAYRARNAFDN
jgi:hypothetical protein